MTCTLDRNLSLKVTSLGALASWSIKLTASGLTFDSSFGLDGAPVLNVTTGGGPISAFVLSLGVGGGLRSPDGNDDSLIVYKHCDNNMGRLLLFVKY